MLIIIRNMTGGKNKGLSFWTNWLMVNLISVSKSNNNLI
jgi:hypothetical protein